MTGEEMERAIEFLLKSQAAFEASFEARQAAFKVEQEKTDEQIRALSVKDQQTREFLDELTQIVERNSQQIERNSQQINHINNILLNVVEGDNRRDEEIDALFKLVGGLIEGRNGKSGG